MVDAPGADQQTDWSKIIGVAALALIGALVLLGLLVTWLADGMTAKFHGRPSYAEQLRREATHAGGNRIYWLGPSEDHHMHAPAVVTSGYAIVAQPIYISDTHEVTVHVQTAFSGTSVYSLPVNNDGYNLVTFSAPNGEHVLVSSPVGGPNLKRAVLRSVRTVPNS